MMRIMPYRTAENMIDGLVMTFIDIDRIKREQQAAETAQRFAESLVEALPAGVAVLDANLKVVTANRALLETFKTTSKNVIGEPIQTFSDGVLDLPALLEQLAQVVESGLELKKFELPVSGHRLGRKHFSVSAHRMEPHSGRPLLLLLILEDIGPPAQAE